MKPRAFLLVLLLTLSSCSLDGLYGSDDAATTTLVVELRDGERKTLPAFNARLRLVEATDGRCPLDVVCASAGTATVALALTPAGETPVSFTLVWPWADGQGLDDEGFIYRDVGLLRFTLLNLRPHPDTRIPDPDPSTATLRVERLP